MRKLVRERRWWRGREQALGSEDERERDRERVQAFAENNLAGRGEL